MLYEGISLTMNSKVLNGSQRVVMDGVISADECQELQRLTNVRNPVTAPSPHSVPRKRLLGAAGPVALYRPHSPHVHILVLTHTPMGTRTHVCVHMHTQLLQLTLSCLLGPLGGSNFRRWLPRSDLPAHPK